MMRELQGSPPQLAEGQDLLLVKRLPNGGYERAIRVARGDTVRFSMELNNTSYSGIENMAAAAHVSRMAGGCWRVLVWVHSTAPTIHSYPVYLVNPARQDIRVLPIAGSTKLWLWDTSDHKDHRLSTLQDGILSPSGIPVPYTMQGGTTWFVDFDARIK
jgi:hypothetical protein